MENYIFVSILMKTLLVVENIFCNKLICDDFSFMFEKNLFMRLDRIHARFTYKHSVVFE